MQMPRLEAGGKTLPRCRDPRQSRGQGAAFESLAVDRRSGSSLR